MRIRVLLFSTARDALATAAVEVDLPEPAHVADVIRALRAAHPALAPLLPNCRVAVNHAIASADQPVAPADEIALIPPVSGG